MATIITGMEINNIASKYLCEKCNFYSNNISNYNAHILTKKHKSNISDEVTNSKKFCCKTCNKEFINASGLWKHKKKCQNKEEKQKDNFLTIEMLFEVLKNSKELQNFLMEHNNKLIEQHIVNI
jgi:hypothetical protein